MKTACNSNALNGKSYVPPPIGNGDLSAQIDMQGVQRQKDYFRMTPGIYRAGRRYDTRFRELIPFGFVEQSSGEPVEWSQKLDTDKALVSSKCRYSDGSTIESEAFAHLEAPILAFRKRFKAPYSFSYVLAEPQTTRELPKRMKIEARAFANGADIVYEIDGQRGNNGAILFLCDKPAKLSIDGNAFSLTAESEGEACFFLAFFDSLDGEDVIAGLLKLKERILAEGFDGLFKTHCAAWAKFWGEGFVKLQDKLAQDVYECSQYHLRASVTKWSIPVGLFPSHWQGRYFGFDEHFSQMGLLTSGHLDAARHVPEFRHKVLDNAKSRAFHYFDQSDADTGARYNWESDENGDDCTPPGFWLEHIFNMACIALGAWHQYIYSGCIDFLSEKGYAIIARCADYYFKHHLYKAEGGRLIVGKCTDLERLGAARENAFMTSCGVIATFEAAAKAAALLKRDEAKASAWSEAAKRLKESLPAENGKYAPYPGCADKSIAVFAGLFPYRCLAIDDPKQLAAITDFISKEAEFGNMYPVGNSVCAWYAGWKGIAFARLGQFDKARACIAQAAGDTQCFSEIFEIAKPANHPWFTTAEGVYAQMVNETLLQSGEGFIKIIEQSGDCSFKLPAAGGGVVEASFSKGVLTSLTLTARRAYRGEIELPGGKALAVQLKSGETKRIV